MNHVYRVIFNRVLGCWQAVTELAKSSGKVGGSVKRSAKRQAAKLAALAAVAAGSGLASGAHAQNAPAPNQLPQGGNVAAGQANINSSGNVMNIDQTTQKAIINWQAFNVGQDATVNFNQPNSSAATLNRVLDSNPSQIFGRIVAPGQVILINPNGAYFAPSASVDVGGLIATTHELADKDFLDGNYQFKRNGASGKIINDGELKAKLDGYIALMAPEVRNQGVIVAERGTVVLAAGEHIQLDFGTGNKLQGITVTEQDLDAQIENKHAIIAEGGLVILSARATAELRASVIKNSGQIVASAGANTVTEKGGRIILEGNTIEVTEGSELIATGPKGGGEILVGGDWQGGANEERRVFDDSDAIHEATTVTVEANTKIDASATDNGDGGTVVVWSDVSNTESVTKVHGEILAMGGENGGDGGQIETSGARLVIDGVAGSTAARNADGQTGEWLFDPYDITISSSTDSNTTSTGDPVRFDANGTSSILNVQTLVAALANSNVTVTTGSSGDEDGNITVAAAISSTSGNSLTLEAANHILIEAGITLSGSDLTLDAGGDIRIDASIDLSSGKLTLEYGQANAAQDNTASYRVNAPVSLSAGQNLTITRGLDGTPVNYQVITALGAEGSTTAADLQGISGDLSGNFALGASIDATSAAGWNENAGWQPIGDSTTPFSGSFEGLGNTIDNLTIDRASESEIGFFGQINGSVSNLQLRNVNIKGLSKVGAIAGVSQGWIFNTAATGQVTGVVGAPTTSNGDKVGGLVGNQIGGAIDGGVANVTVRGKNFVGGLVGFMSNDASANDTYASGEVIGSTGLGGLIGSAEADSVVTNSRATGDVTGYSSIGGLVGRLNHQASVANSFATGNVYSSIWVGGLVGYMADNSSITGAYATGDVSGSNSVGGLVGLTYLSPSITEVYASGSISGGDHVGGLIGWRSDNAVLTNAYWDVDTTGLSNAVGRGDQVGTAIRSSSPTVDAYTQVTYSGYDFDDVWFMVDGHTRPFLRMERSTTIRDAIGLQLMGADPTANYTLANDIDLAAALSNPSSMWRGTFTDEGFKGSFGLIGTDSAAFSGTLAGNGYRLSGFSVTASSNVVDGLFGAVNGSPVSGLKLVGANIQTSGFSQMYTSSVTLVDDTVLDASSIQIDGAVEVGTDHNLHLTFTSASSINGRISGDGGVTISGSSAELRMNQVGTYTGGTSINSGIVVLEQSSNDPLSEGPLGTGGVTVSSGATLDLNGQTLGNALSLAGNGVSNAGALTNSSGDLDGPGSATGAITLAAGTRITASSNLTLSGSIDGGYALTLDATAPVIFGGAVGVNERLGVVTINQSTSITISGTFSAASFNQAQAGTGVFKLDGALDTDAGAITIDSAEVDLNASITTIAGNNGTADNGKVTISAGDGGVDLAAEESITTTTVADSGVTSGAIDIDSAGNVSLAGNLVTLGSANNSGAGAAGGAVTIDTTGASSISVADIQTSGGLSTAIGGKGGAAGAVTITTGTGLITLNASSIRAIGGLGDTSADDGAGAAITFNDPVVLAGGASLIDTGATAGDITFNSTINSEADPGGGSARRALTLNAGMGDIKLLDAVGLNSNGRLGQLKIERAADVTASSINASSLMQDDLTVRAGGWIGWGTTTFNGAIDTDALGGVNISGNNLVFKSTIDTSSGGPVSLSTARGTITLESGADITSSAAVRIQVSDHTWGSLQTAGHITANGSVVDFYAKTTLTGDIEIDTGPVGAAVTFLKTLDSKASEGRKLTINAPASNITFQEAVGGAAGGILGDVIIESAGFLTANQPFKAASFRQNAGSDQTTFNGAIDITGDFNFTGSTLVLNAAGNNVDGVMNLNVASGKAFSTGLNADLTVGGQFSQTGVGTNSVGGDITSTTAGLSFASNVFLFSTGTVTLTTGGGEGDDLVVGGSVTNDEKLKKGLPKSLIINAGSDGDVSITGLVNLSKSHLTIQNADQVTFTGPVTATNFTQALANISNGSTTFNGQVTLSGNVNFTGRALTINAANNTVGGTMDVTNSGLFTTADTANLTVTGQFTQDGTSTSSIGANLTGTAGIDFQSGIVVTGNDSVTLATGGLDTQDIMLGTDLTTDITGSGQALSLNAGSDGDITINGDLGLSSASFSAITVTNASNLVLNGSVFATGTVSLTANLIDINAGVMAAGQLIDINADVGGLTIDGAAISTSGSGAAAGAIDIDSVGNVVANADLLAVGGANASGSGYAGGSVTIDVTGASSTIDVASIINTSGGASTDPTGPGGAADAITLNTAGGLITLTGSTQAVLSAIGGAGGASGTQGTGGNITLSDKLALVGQHVLITTGASAGDIRFSGVVDSAVATSLELVTGAGHVDFEGDVGVGNPLGSVTTDLVGNVTIGGEFRARSYLQRNASRLDEDPQGNFKLLGDMLISQGRVDMTAGSFELEGSIRTLAGSDSADRGMLGMGYFGGAGDVWLQAFGDLSLKAGETIRTTAQTPGTDSGGIFIVADGQIDLAGDVTTAGTTDGEGGAIVMQSGLGMSLTNLTTTGGAASAGSNQDGHRAGDLLIGTFDGDRNINRAGVISLLGSIVSADGGLGDADFDQGAGGLVKFESAVVLTGDDVQITTGDGGGDIVFNSTIDSDTVANASGLRALTLTSGAGDISFDSTVGNQEALGAVTVTWADDVTVGSSFKVLSYLQYVQHPMGFPSTMSGKFTLSGDMTAYSGPIKIATDSIEINGNIRTLAGSASVDRTFFGRYGGAGDVWMASGLGDISLNASKSITTAARTEGVDSGGILISAGANASMLGHLNTAGNIGGQGGAVSLYGDTSVTIVDITTDGGNAADSTGGAGLAAGQIDILSLFGTITLQGGTISAVGGDGDGQGAQGAGANIDLQNKVSLTVGSSLITSGATGGHISFNDTVNGAQALTVTAGTGDVVFKYDNSGPAPVTAHVGNDTPLAALTVSGANITLRNVKTTGQQQYTASGVIDTNSSYISDGGDIIFSGDTLMKSALVVDTTNLNNLTDPTAKGSVTFGGSLNSEADEDNALSITAGSGNISFNGDVGTATDGELGAVLVASVATLRASSLEAVSFTQNTGTVKTQFDGAVNLTGGFVFTGAALQFNDLVSLGGNVMIANTGTFTTASAANITASAADSTFSQTGPGTNILAADVTTNSHISFDGPITLADAVRLTTGTGAGNITLGNTVDGAHDLILTAGSGDVVFGNTGPVANVGSGTPLSSISATAGNITLRDISTTGIQGYTASGTIALNGDHVTEGGDVTFNGAVRLDDAVSIDTTNNGDALTPGDIKFAGTIMSKASQFNTLTTRAASGDVRFEDSVGGTLGGSNRLGAIIITSARHVTVTNGKLLHSDALTQLAGSGITTFDGVINIFGEMDLIGTDFNFKGQVSTTSGEDIRITNTGALTIDGGAYINAGGQFLQVGAGPTSTVSLGAGISTGNAKLSFEGDVTLTQPISLDTGNVGGDIVFGGKLDAAVAHTQTLTLRSEGGDVFFNNDVGMMAPLGDVFLNKTRHVTIAKTFIARSFNQSIAGSGTFTVSGLLATDTEGLLINSHTVDFKGGVRTTAGVDASTSSDYGAINISAGIGGVTLDAGRTISTTPAADSTSASSVTITSVGPIELFGAVVTKGTASSTGNGGSGGDVTLQTTGNQSHITIASLDLSGADSALAGASGGNAGTVSLTSVGDSIYLAGGTIRSSGGQATNAGTASSIQFMSPVQLINAATEIDTGGTGGSIGFARSVTGSQRLTLKAGDGPVEIFGVVGSKSLVSDRLAGLNILTTGPVVTHNDVYTTGDLSITGSLIGFNGDEYVSTSGDIRVSGTTYLLKDVGMRAVNTVFNGSIDSPSDVSDLSKPSANRTLTITGDARLNQAIGNTHALGALRISGASTLAGGLIKTIGDQAYDDSVRLAADTTINADGGRVTFGSRVDSDSTVTPRSLSVTSNTNRLVLQGDVGSLAALKPLIVPVAVTIAGDVTTQGDQRFMDAVLLTGNARLAAQNLTFDGTVNGGHALTLAAQSVARFNAAVGDTTPLASLTAEASGQLQINTTQIRTQNSQTFNAPIVFSQGSLAVPLVLQSLAGDIDLGSTVSAGTNAKGAQRSLSLQASNGNVYVRDQIGLNLDGVTPASYATQTDVNPYALTVNAQDIWLLADVTTFEEQTYTGSVHVGNNGSNGSTRLLVSLDPRIRINGSIDDMVADGHTLDLRAVNLDPTSMLMPEIYLGGPVGQQIPLLALNVFTGVQSPLPGAALSDVNLDPMARLGRVTIVDNVSTYGDQTYASGSIALGNTTQSTVVLYSETGAVNLLTHPGVSGGLINGNRLQFVLREGVSLSADTLAALAQAGLDVSSVVRFVAAPAMPTPASGLFTGQVTYDSEFLARLQANRDRQLEFERVQAMSEQSGVLEVEVKVGELDGLECVAQPPDNTTVTEDC